jgi:hypothetical protein
MGMANPGEQLRQLTQQFHRLKQEGRRTGADGTRSRRQGQELAALEGQFEALLLRWVADEGERERWREYAHHFGDLPPTVSLSEPPLFKGLTEAGRDAAVRVGSDGACEVLVDGKVTRRMAGGMSLGERWLQVLRIEGQGFQERFEASADAIEALDGYVRDPARGAPWDCARELYEDGLIDPNFALTARGKRLMDARRNGGGGVAVAL